MHHKRQLGHTVRAITQVTMTCAFGHWLSSSRHNMMKESIQPTRDDIETILAIVSSSFKWHCIPIVNERVHGEYFLHSLRSHHSCATIHRCIVTEPSSYSRLHIRCGCIPNLRALCYDITGLDLHSVDLLPLMNTLATISYAFFSFDYGTTYTWYTNELINAVCRFTIHLHR